MNERQLFESALEIADPQARQAFLDTACQGKDDLRDRIASLLAAHGTAGPVQKDQAAGRMERGADKIAINTPLGTPAGGQQDRDESPSQKLDTADANQVSVDSDPRSATTLLLANGSENEAGRTAPDSAFRETAPLTDNRDDSDDEIALGYLEASSKPGSLGRLAHYEVLEVVGRGAFGTVLRAFDEKLQRVVAIKVMAPELASTSPARKRFLREAQASAAIRHEHVVSIHAVEEKPLPYLVMEYIPGQTLQQRLEEHGPLDVTSVLRLGRQIAEGLAAAHAFNLVHRDIKPGNILLETGVHDRVKITDFGLARAADDASLTQSGTIAGTPMYMAPEQALGKKLDQRADLFSFGSVLYQMVSGRPPFRAPTALAVLKRVAEEEPRPISEIIPEVPAWLCSIVAKLHAKNPDERYQTAQEVAEVLANCESQLKDNSRLQDFSRIPRVASQSRPHLWKWIAAVALLLPVLTMTLTEATGLTAIVRSRQPDRKQVLEAGEKQPLVNSPEQQVVESQSQSQWIDVLPLIDPLHDRWSNSLTGKNEWRMEGGELVAGYADDKPCKLLVPLDAAWRDFECEVDFTRRSGTGGININIPTTVGDCPVVFGASKATGVFLGRRVGGVALNQQMSLETGKRTSLRVKVLREDDLDHIAVWVDDAAAGTWKGDRSGIATVGQEGYPHARRMSLWVHGGGNEIVFHRIRVRMLDGSRAETRHLVPAVNSPETSRNDTESLTRTFTNKVGMEFMIVPKGKSWLQGSNDHVGNQAVEIPADFYLGKYEVTQDEWTRVMEANPSSFSRTGSDMNVVKDISDADLKRFPVENVSWDNCDLFVAKLNKLEGETGWVYRLPRHVEWEYACRGGPMNFRADSAFDYYLAQPTNTISPEFANVADALQRTCKVGSYPANSLGLFDMHGNVWEWCDSVQDVPDGAQLNAGTRGGCWTGPAEQSATVRGNSATKSYRDRNTGFRVARVPFPEVVTPPVAAIVATSVAAGPFTDAEVQRIAALPAEHQVAAVRRELIQRNSLFDGKVEHKIEDGVVTELQFVTDRVVDISPVRALQRLVSLKLGATALPGRRGKLSDISPLKGLSLKQLELSSTQVTSIEVLRDMPLVDLNLDRVPVSDLSPLTGKVLKSLHIGGTKVKSLSDVPVASSEVIHCHLPQISDKAELQRLGVKFLDLWGVPETADPERLRALQPPLSRVNGKPLEEFLKEKGSAKSS